jgi:hypothetical protein
MFSYPVSFLTLHYLTEIGNLYRVTLEITGLSQMDLPDLTDVARRMSLLKDHQLEMVREIASGKLQKEMAAGRGVTKEAVNKAAAAIYRALTLTGHPLLAHRRELAAFLGRCLECYRKKELLASKWGEGNGFAGNRSPVSGAITIALPDAASVTAFEAVGHVFSSGAQEEKTMPVEMEATVDGWRKKGYQPEFVALYPTADPQVSFAQILFVRRKNKK